MARYDTFTFRIGPAEAEALARLADQLERSQSDAVRILIRNAARERGLLPTQSETAGAGNVGGFKTSLAGDATPAIIAGMAQPATSQGARHANA